MKNADSLNLAHPHVEQSLKMETGGGGKHMKCMLILLWDEDDLFL